MKDMIRSLFPLHRIFTGKVALLTVFLAGWCLYHFPFFENMGQRYFFSYDLSYWSSLLNGGKLSNFINHFLAQFYGSSVGIIVIQLFLSLVFLLCSYRTGGHYAIFMLPLWLVLASSTDNNELNFLIGLLFNLIALGLLFVWITFRETSKQSNRFYYEVFYLKYWIYYVLAGCFLFFCCGGTAILFLGVIVLYRLFILLSSIGKRHGNTDNVDSAAIGFGVYLITGVAIAFVFPKQLVVPSFMLHWSWIKWTVFILFIVALLANLLQSTLKRNLNRPHHSTWFILVAGIVVSILSTGFNASPLKRNLVMAENACQRNHYGRVLEFAGNYFEKHPQPHPNIRRPVASRRYALSAYLRLSLLMEGKLNADFFRFRHVPEMKEMFPSFLPFTKSSNFAYAKLYYETGLYGSAIPLMVHTLDRKGCENRIFRLLVPIEAASYQRPLLDKHLDLLKKSLGNRNFALRWERINRESIEMGIPDGEQPVGMGFILNPTQTAIDKLIEQKVTKTLFKTDIIACSWHGDRFTSIAENINLSRAVNLPALEYYSLLCLLEGNLDRIPVLAAHYAELETETLPPYIQEAILIRSGLLDDPELKTRLMARGYMGFRFDPDIMNRCLLSAQALHENADREQTDAEFGDTYTYYYLTHIGTTATVHDPKQDSAASLSLRN